MGRVVDAADLERRVKEMYTQVARDPQGRYHFEMGRAMASRLGYTDEELNAAPAASIESQHGPCPGETSHPTCSDPRRPQT